jgi:TetR/AcrR family acrAB operon transcriptional repressor
MYVWSAMIDHGQHDFSRSFHKEPRMARNTKQEAQETRNRILDAAADVFHRKGVSRTSLANVAEEAGLTRGAIYWHFKNKIDLFTAMADRVRLPMEAMVGANAADREADPLGQLRRLCVFVLQETARNPQSRKVFDIIFHKCEYLEDADPISKRQNECFREGEANIEAILRNACAKGQLPAHLDTHLAGVAFHAALDGLMNNWLLSPENFDLAGNAERLIDACLDMLRSAASLRTAPPQGVCAAEEPRLQCARNRSILKSPTAPRGPPWACRCSQTVLGFRTFRFAAFCRAGSWSVLGPGSKSPAPPGPSWLTVAASRSTAPGRLPSAGWRQPSGASH